MKTFQVLRHPTLGYQAVKLGFSWPAACFSIIWLLWCRLWAKSGLLIGLFFGFLVLLSIAANTLEIPSATAGLVFLSGLVLLWILPGFTGNTSRIKGLKRRGFESLSVLQAKTEDSAIESVSTLGQGQSHNRADTETLVTPATSATFSVRKLSNFRFFCWFILVNICIISTTTIVSFGALPVAIVIGIVASAGSVLSLFLSRWLAIKAHSIVIVDKAIEHDLTWLVTTVENLSKKLQLPSVPQIGVWPGPEVNAFATGPRHKRALIAFSIPLLEHLSREEIAAVAAHELAHIANRDMLAMTMLQGVANTFILTAILPVQIFRLFNFLSDKFSWTAEFSARVVKFCIVALLTFISSLFIKAFSRRREYRADAVAAHLVGIEHMKSALQRLSGLSAEEQQVTQFQASFAPLKITGRGLIELLSTHPLVEKRIDALEQSRFAQ